MPTKVRKITTKSKLKKPKPKLKTKAKSKLKTKSTPKAHARHAEKNKQPTMTFTKKPRKVAAAGDDPYAKRIFVRFETAELKEMVRKAADAVPMSLSAYIAAAAAKLAKEGWKPELKPQAVETADEAKAS